MQDSRLFPILRKRSDIPIEVSRFAIGWHTAAAVEEHRKLSIDKTRLTVLRGFLLKVWNNVIFGLQAEEKVRGMQGFGSRKRKSLRI